MRQYLIPEEGRFYKANMHTHTTCSDGQLTPEEIATQTGYASAAAFDRAMKRYGIWDVRLCEQETDTQEEAPAGGIDAFEEDPEE